MLRSLYSGVSGMRSFQAKMDVISNNIANVNTTAFKSGRVRFQDTISQTLASAQAATDTGLAGVNPQQIGLGVRVGGIDNIMTGGPLQASNRDLDFAIEREGFFIVSDDSAGNIKYYTRDGAFYKDHEGNLININGLRVLGYLPPSAGEYDFEYLQLSDPDSPNLEVPSVDEDYYDNLQLLKPIRIPNTIEVDGDTLKLEVFSIDGTGRVIGVFSDGNPYLLGQVGMAIFNNPGGLEKVGNNNFRSTNNSGQPEAGIAGQAGYGIIRQNFLEMSNVDLANEFTEMIITGRAYQANSRSITASDEMLMELLSLKR